MTPSRMRCREFRRLLARTASPRGGALGLDRVARSHVLDCASCRAALGSARRADAALAGLSAGSLDPAHPPRRGRDPRDPRFFTALEAEVLLAVSGRAARPVTHRRFAVTAAAVALFGLGILVTALVERPRRSRLFDVPSLESLEPFAFDAHGSTVPVGESAFRGLRGRALIEELGERHVRRPAVLPSSSASPSVSAR